MTKSWRIWIQNLLFVSVRIRRRAAGGHHSRPQELLEFLPFSDCFLLSAKRVRAQRSIDIVGVNVSRLSAQRSGPHHQFGRWIRLVLRRLLDLWIAALESERLEHRRTRVVATIWRNRGSVLVSRSGSHRLSRSQLEQLVAHLRP